MARHALLVGVSRFTDQRLARLNAPIEDVRALRRVLEDPVRGGFDSVTLSEDEDFLAIRDHLARLFHDRTPGDLLLLYYSGHGVLGRGNRLFLATTGSDLDVPQMRSIAAREVRDFMTDSRAGCQLIVLDCCHSGAFAEHAKAGAPAPAVTADTFAAGESGVYVLTASDALQYAWDGTEQKRVGPAQGLSHFTSWLVKGLDEGEAAPDSEQITMDALYRYTQRKAREEGAAATPQRFVLEGGSDPVIGRNPLAGQARIDPETAAALESEDWRQRMGAVVELELQMREGHAATSLGARMALQRRLERERDFRVRQLIQRAMSEKAAGVGGTSQSPEEKPARPAQPDGPAQPYATRPQEQKPGVGLADVMRSAAQDVGDMWRVGRERRQAQKRLLGRLFEAWRSLSTGQKWLVAIVVLLLLGMCSLMSAQQPRY